LVVRDRSDFRNLPMLVQFIYSNAPSVRLHLLMWQISLRRVPELKPHFVFPIFSQSIRTPAQMSSIFETITLQGSLEKEDLTEMCSMFLTKTQAIAFLSCQIDFKRINITENLEAIQSIRIKGDSEILRLQALLDACPNIRRLEYCGISTFDQISKYSLADKLKSLQRVVLSTYFFNSESLDSFLNQLPELSYLELSQVSLNENQMVKCLEKFQTMVVFSHPDIPLVRR
jgi:hypothetical protein